MPAAVGLAVLTLVLAIGLLLPWIASATADERQTSATIPDRLPDYSYLTGPVSGPAPGRAIAIYQHGFMVEFLDFPQAVMVGADRDVTRRMTLAERRGGAEAQGDAGPMALSPDGTTVAVGVYNPDEPTLALLDLTSGRTRTYAVESGRSAVPIAWSPDSTRVAYLTTTGPANPHNLRVHVVGGLGMLDVGTGKSHRYPGDEDVWSVAFSPDGTELAVQRLGSLQVVGPDGETLRTLDSLPGHRLDGPNAWSPDGALLATTSRYPNCYDPDHPFDYAAEYACLQEADYTFFVDATGRGRDVPAALSYAASGGYGILGWTGDREVVVLDDATARHNPEDDDELYRVTALDLHTGRTRGISTVNGDGNFGIGHFQLAAGLVPDAQVREAGGFDRGRWPAPLLGGAALLAGGVAFLLARVVMRHRPRRDRRPELVGQAGLEPATDGL